MESIILTTKSELETLIISCLKKHENQKANEQEVYVTINKAREYLGKNGKLASHNTVNNLISKGSLKITKNKRIPMSSINECIAIIESKTV